jgi:hypothetical protein
MSKNGMTASAELRSIADSVWKIWAVFTLKSKCGYYGAIKAKGESPMVIFLGFWVLLCILAL